MAWTERYVTTTGAGAHDGTSEANAWDLAEAIAGVNAGHRVNVKAGTYANTTTSRTFGTGAGAGTTTAPKWWRGYTSTIGDLDGHPATTRTAGTDFPLFTFTSGIVTVSDSHNMFSNIEFRGTAPGQRLVGITGAKIKFVRCRFDNQEAGATSYACRGSADGQQFLNCWFKATSTATFVFVSDEPMQMTGCVFRGGGTGLITTASRGGAYIDCVFDDNGVDGISLGGNGGSNEYIDGCTFYSPGGHGIDITTAIPAAVTIRNCLFHTITTASKYAVNCVSNSNVPLLASNAYYDVTDRYNNVTEDLEFFPITLASDPFTNAAGRDFSLVSGAKGTALPQLFENESFKSWMDPGAIQREEAAAGGASGHRIIGG